MAQIGKEKIDRMTIVIEGDEAYRIQSEFWNLARESDGEGTLQEKCDALRAKAPDLANFLTRLDQARRI